jgi:TATA-box binding protein (TBP) (component of TFIID and TFIIIB)
MYYTRDGEIDLSKLPPLNYVNFVFAVDLFPKDSPLKLPLHKATELYPFIQYAPSSFAAVILKLNSDVSKPTALVFAPGKVVIVTGISESDVILYSHQVRFIMEKVPFRAYDPEKKRVVFDYTLRGKTGYYNPHTHNIVANVNLKVPLDLDKMHKENIAAFSYMPKIFPGGKMDVWLVPSYKCECNRNGRTAEEIVINSVVGKIQKAGKCKCKIKVLCFPDGQLVFTGGRSTQSLHQSYLHTCLVILKKYVKWDVSIPVADDRLVSASMRTLLFEEATRRMCQMISCLPLKTFDTEALTQYKYVGFEGRPDLEEFFAPMAIDDDSNRKRLKME